MVINRRAPVDYSLCNQTVTIYHRDGNLYTSAVHHRAFFEFKKTEDVNKIGSHEKTGFLLVIPGDKQAVFAGDKIFLGEGKEVSTPEAWAAMNPVEVPNLAVVSYATPKFWNGAIIHTEAGA